MEDLKQIYERITFLRSKGIKMKEIAEHTRLAPSVLSALYSTVLPNYISNREKGLEAEEALDQALIWVNNVSKKKISSTVHSLKEALFSMDTTLKYKESFSQNPFWEGLYHNLQETTHKILTYSGIYLSYSISSSSKALKVEPYFMAISEDGNYVEVGHCNAYGNTHWGVALMNGMNHLYLMFNEKDTPQMALFHICLKLPMFNHPQYLRGIYTSLDYNYNPIARRILFVKVSDSIDKSDFLTMRGKIKPEEQLDEKEQIYYQYTCQQEDIIRMCAIPAPQMTEDDLILEKKILTF